MLESIKNAYNSNIPIYAESGGYMYLGSTIEGKDMVNIFDYKS